MLMGRHDCRKAEPYYHVALIAAQHSQDLDLLAYVLGSWSFCDVCDGRLSVGLQRIEQAHSLDATGISGTTLSWLSALASELHARNGDEVAAQRSLDQAQTAMSRRDPAEPPWRGVGDFDQARLTGYEGGNLVLLHRPRDAEPVLVRSLTLLPPSRLKHRATVLADLAATLAHPDFGEVEEACRRATEALGIATRLQHAESIQRVWRVHQRLKAWHAHPAVRSLGEQLILSV